MRQRLVTGFSIKLEQVEPEPVYLKSLVYVLFWYHFKGKTSYV